MCCVRVLCACVCVLFCIYIPNGSEEQSGGNELIGCEIKLNFSTSLLCSFVPQPRGLGSGVWADFITHLPICSPSAAPLLPHGDPLVASPTGHREAQREVAPPPAWLRPPPAEGAPVPQGQSGTPTKLAPSRWVCWLILRVCGLSQSPPPGSSHITRARSFPAPCLSFLL